MPLPFIFAAMAAFAGGAGAIAGVVGLDQIEEAKRIGRNAEERYNYDYSRLLDLKDKLEKNAEDLTYLKKSVYEETIEKRYLRIWYKFQKNKLKKISNKNIKLKITQEEVKAFEHQAMTFKEASNTLIKSVKAGASTSIGALGLVGTLGTASTGTLIATLKGAAATNAKLAWFGGGSLAVGGFGMAGGTLVLGILALGPAIAVGGFKLAANSEKALTEALEYRSRVNKACELIDFDKAALKGLQARIIEVAYIINNIDSRLSKCLFELEEMDKSLGNKESYSHLELDENQLDLMYKADTLAKGLKEILEIQVLTSDEEFFSDKIECGKELIESIV